VITHIFKGGSFYLQSKIYRAKELLDDYVKEKNAENLKDEGGKVEMSADGDKEDKKSRDK